MTNQRKLLLLYIVKLDDIYSMGVSSIVINKKKLTLGKSPKLQIPKLQKHMDMCPYAPAAEAHEIFSYAFVKKWFCKNETLHKNIFFVKIAISFSFSQSILYQRWK